MGKKGITLIETVISIFVVSVVLVTFMQALSVGITGTLDLNRKTSALNLAKSQIDNVKSQTYNDSTGDLSNVYGLITTGGNISDVVNYVISGQVENVDIEQPLQRISVNVNYMEGRGVELTGYKLSDGSLSEPSPRGLLVTDNMKNLPTMPPGYSFFCYGGAYKGYYNVFEVGTEGTAALHWKAEWSRISSDSSMGAPMMAIYEGIPPWAQRDYLGNVRESGIVVRNQNAGITWLPDVIGVGDLPGPGDSNMCLPCGDASDFPDEENPIAYAPHHCGIFQGALTCLLGGHGVTKSYPCCGACFAGHLFWTYDWDLGQESGYVEYTLTANLQPGTYTALLFNAENLIELKTISASVTYWY